MGAALGLMGLALGVPDAAGQVYVDDDAPPGGDGLSWQTAFRDVQQGFDALGGATRWTVLIAGGTYLAPNDFISVRGGFHAEVTGVASGTVVVIRGGFAGLSDPDHPDTYNPSAYVTLLDGDKAQNDDSDGDDAWLDNARHVLQFSCRAGVDLRISGLVIANGSARLWDHRPVQQGGGLYVIGPCSTELRDCVFSGNRAGVGGALCATQGSIFGIDCVFVDNEAELGGAIACLGSQRVEFTRSVFRRNQASLGGAVAIVGAPQPHGNLAFNTCLFDSNATEDLGGAIYSISGRVAIGGCTFWNNRDRLGGAFFAQGGVIRVRSTILWSEHPGRPVQLAGSSFLPTVATFDDNIVAGGVSGLAYTAEGVTLDSFEVSGDDPLLADPLGPDGRPASGDENFNPTTNSPAVGRGTSDLPGPHTETDLDGDPRSVGRADIGAFELRCLADLTGAAEEPNPLFGVPDGRIDDEDYYYFLHFFELGDPRMDLSGSTDPADPRYNRPDGVVDMTDFFRFLDDLANPCYP